MAKNSTMVGDLERLVGRMEVAARKAEEAENAAKRHLSKLRRTLVIVIFFWFAAVLAAITLHDEHVKRCMIPVADPPAACDIIFPFHDHDDLQDELKAYLQDISP